MPDSSQAARFTTEEKVKRQKDWFHVSGNQLALPQTAKMPVHIPFFYNINNIYTDG
jgi:hypothetical protein